MRRLWVLVAIPLALGLADRAQAVTRGRGEGGSRVQRPRISALYNTTCAVLDDGTPRCWGANALGQIGNGTVTTSQTPPAQPTGIGGVVAVATGQGHACVLLGSGLVKCWGDNSSGQLGNGTSGGPSNTAVSVSGLTLAVAIAAGENFTCVLRVDGTARCWGFGNSGQLGNGTFNNSSVPVTVSGLSNAVAITAGRGHACALLADGTARCWGSGNSGKLGNGSAADQESPVPVSGLNGAVAVVAGYFHTCALLVDGSGQCWGRNLEGQLGDGTLVSKTVPTPVSQLTQAIAIATGFTHTCAVRSDGGMRCWGNNQGGQLGDGTTTSRLDAGTPVVGLSNAVEVTAGDLHTCALDTSGTARCWGDNGFGQLGNGTFSPSSVPATVTGVTGSTAGRGIVAGGNAFSCARRASGAAACWGQDSEGELGNGSPFADSSKPLTVSGLADAVALTAGVAHACALRSSGTVVCWGGNFSGSLGNRNTTASPTPVAVAGLSGAVDIAAGRAHTCALLFAGTVRCWGDNGFGQLGNNSFVDSLVPASVVALTGAVAIVAGEEHTCARVVDGTVRCWGANASGQLGDGTNANSAHPVAVIALTNVVALAATGGLSSGQGHTCAVLANGGARCWGQNNYGQLGNSTTQDRTVPDVVSGLTDALAVTAGGTHTCVVRATGNAACWGHNTDGQLAAADTADYTTPTPVISTFGTLNGVLVPISLRGVVAMAAAGASGGAHTCALQGSGLPLCWGDNSAGQLGNLTFTDRKRPTAVPSFTANVDPDVTLEPNGRIAEVTALLNCEPDSHGQIFVSLTQGSVAGSGAASTNCGFGFLEVPVTVAARGREAFQPGAATANLEAIVRDHGEVTQHLFWTRDVILATP
jgi:alpha-tubulin suppressor-like RCC1 family protein